MCLAALLFTCMNTLVKYLSPHLNPVQIIWARILGHLLFMLALFVPSHGLAIVRSKRLGVQMTRSLLQIMSTTFYFVALQQVSLAEATTVSFLTPMLVALLAVPMLGERMRPVQAFAVALGFVGVLIVLRPGGDVFRWGSILLLGNITCYALYQILTRRVSTSDPAETSAIYSALIGALIMSALVPFFWATPASLLHAVLLATLGLFGGLGHYCVACSLGHGPANLMSPFMYFQLIGAVVFGYLLFDDVPGLHTWIGAGLIILCGLFLGWSQSRPAAPVPAGGTAT